MKSYRKLNKKNKNKKNKTKTRRRHYRGGSGKCPRSACRSDDIECDIKNNICHCLTCNITTPSQYFYGPAKDYGDWIQNGDAKKWVNARGYSTLILE